jgi:tRNA threonylcarbamoyladenosine biosynthesis protein TsaB
VNILAIDTSTEACSAALLRDDGQIFSEFEIAPRQHTRLLPKMMDSVLKASSLSKKSLTHCAFANGPGAFTGIRIAAATAQGIAIGLGIPVIQISTLATLAQTCLLQYAVDNTLVALDARMGEVYWAWYKRDKVGLAALHGTEKLTKLEDVTLDPTTACGVGHGWAVGGELWMSRSPDCSNIKIDPELLPDASALVKLAVQAVNENRYVSAENTSINYLRNRVAEKPRP